MLRPLTHPIQFLACLCVALGACAFADEPSAPTISVSGRAEVRVVPDQVQLRFGLESRAQRLADATSDNEAKVKRVVEFLRRMDVPERNIRTEAIWIGPIYSETVPKAVRQASDPFAQSESSGQSSSDFDPLNPLGYTVRRKFSITTEDLGRFEEIYRGLIEGGVNEIDSIAFNTTKLREHRDRARLDAIRAAKDKAGSLAGELGAELAGVQSITESESGGYGGSQNAFFDDPFGGTSDEGTITAGEIQIRATVHVVFRLRSTDFE